MGKINKTLAIGLGIYGITQLLDKLIGLPEFLNGLGLGTAIAFELIGIYSMNHDISRIKSFKKGLLRNIKFGSVK